MALIADLEAQIDVLAKTIDALKSGIIVFSRSSER